MQRCVIPPPSYPSSSSLQQLPLLLNCPHLGRVQSSALPAAIGHTLTLPPPQPQRIRVRGDENAPLALHQRNKSTPALSTMFQNNQPKINGPKRAAFGDVSNTANLLRANRDDAVAVKNLSKVSEKAPVLAPEKHVALSQPAQRPVSVSGVRASLNNATNQKPAEVNPNLRKALSKRDTVYRDGLQPLPEARDSASKEVTNQTVQDAKLGHISRPATAPIQHALRETAAPKDDMKSHHDSAEGSVSIPGIGAGEREAKSYEDDCKVHGDESHEHYSIPPETHATDVARYHRSVALSYPVYDQMHPQSEPEEYWDEDDYENEYEDGYLTARSYRSRGDNTTGGATTVLFPKYNNQVRRELAIAKQIVDSTRTAEDIEDEYWDTSMVAEYNDEIFEYIREQEVCCLKSNWSL